MGKRGFVVFLTLNYFFSSIIYSNTLYKDIEEVLETNPIVQERLKNFRASQQDVKIANSEYYPTLDLRMVASYNKAGNDNQTILYNNVEDSEYESYESSLTFTQNLFNGFSTLHQIDYQKSKSLVSAYKYIEKANEMAFRMSEAYIKVLKTQDLLQTARQNVQINESIYSKVKELSDSGLTTNSEVKKIHSSLSLARSKLTVAKNNALEAKYNYRRILGRMPDLKTMQEPKFDIVMPSSVDEAALFAIEHNPSLLVSLYNIKSAEALYKQNYKGYYPKIDLEISQTYNDAFPTDNGFTTTDDRFKARLILTYNLFKGGLDKAQIQKNISKINQEVELKRDVKRQVVEDLDVAWKFYEMTVAQLKDLKEYGEYAEETMVLYKEEYNLGRRTLLDLLTAQNDVINSREQIIKTKYDKLFAKYRILDAMGILIETITGNFDKYTSKVNLVAGKEIKNIVDKIPVDNDIDEDKIIDDFDLCDNSEKGSKVLNSGCKRVVLDSDNDGIIDAIDKCPLTNQGVKVSSDGCEYDSDGDGVVDSQDDCPNTPKGKKVSINGCFIKLFDKQIDMSEYVFTQDEAKMQESQNSLTVFYKKNSYKLSSKAKQKIKRFSKFLKKNKNYDVIISGHASKEGTFDEMQELSQKRAKSVFSEIVKHGIDDIRLSSEGMGDSEPIAFGNEPKDIELNRRVETILVDVSGSSNINKTVYSSKKEDKKKDLTTYNLDINFDKNSYIILDKYRGEIHKFAEFLRKNPQYKVDILSYTDDVCSDGNNKWLSQMRAKEVVLSLIQLGIDKSRLSYKGMGDEEPVSFGTSEKDLLLNCRIEVDLIK